MVVPLWERRLLTGIELFSRGRIILYWLSKEYGVRAIGFVVLLHYFVYCIFRRVDTLTPAYIYMCVYSTEAIKIYHELES